MQFGTQSGKASMAVAVEVAVALMTQKGIVPKFTIREFRDNIPAGCGVRSQSRVFNRLDKPTGTISIKVPVIHASVFPQEISKCE